MSTEGLQPLYAQVEGNIVSNMGEETVLMSIENGKYYNLGEIGGVIWKHLATPATLEQIVDQMTAEYDVSKKECEEHVLSFLNDLLAENIVQIHEDEA